MSRFGRCNVRPLKVLGLAAIAVGSVGVIAAMFGVRINTSYSLPLGLYVTTSDPSARLIEFCPEEPFASQSSVRGYRTAGFACPDGAVPLLKPIAAVEGDEVEVSEDGLAVNGHLLPHTRALAIDWAGRALSPWPVGQYRFEPGTVWVASTYNRGSFDSRYMGPIRLSQIRTRLKPLWLLK
jgi:conjugative transfer signal peptidase TraF